MAHTNALADALRIGSQAKGKMAGLDEDYAAATSMRDAPMSGPNKYGQLNPVLALAETMRGIVGQNKVQGMRGQRADTRTALAESENALPLYKARVNAAKVEQDQANFETAESDVLELENIADPTQRIQARSFGGKLFGKDNQPLDPTEWQQVQKLSRASGSRYTRSKSEDAYGNDVITVFDKRTGEEDIASFGDGSSYSMEEAKSRGGTRAGQKGAEELAKAGAKYSIGRQGDLMKNSRANAETVNSLDTSIRALQAGAGSGPIESRLPSFKRASITLDNMKDKMGLTEIGNYTLGSLSEAEGLWLRQAGMPPLDEDDLLPYLEHRKEATLRVMEANQYEQDALAAGEAVDQTLINDILSDGGFDISEYGYE